jgi:hypothetical protein
MYLIKTMCSFLRCSCFRLQKLYEFTTYKDQNYIAFSLCLTIVWTIDFCNNFKTQCEPLLQQE